MLIELRWHCLVGSNPRALANPLHCVICQHGLETLLEVISPFGGLFIVTFALDLISNCVRSITGVY